MSLFTHPSPRLQLGIFLDARNPAAWHTPWPEHYRRLVELVVRAEELGADAVWLTEHHFFADGYLPQPLVLASALAARTRRIRLGTAILIAPLRHPVHIAEEAAIVDQISGGRLELGLGAGWAAEEFAAFGAPFEERFATLDSAVRDVRTALAERVSPPPLQQPLPLWVGYQRPAGARRAGRLGVGLLSLDRATAEPYLAGIAEGGHEPATARMGGLLDVIVADEPEAAYRRIAPHHAHQLNTYAAAHACGTGKAPSALTAETLLAREGPAGALSLNVCTPQNAVAAIRTATAGLPVAHVYVWASVAGMPRDLVDRHLELMFTEVAGEVRSQREVEAT
jgi:alkanesulfonate monooxygenase SsuD/methylene tetrahydromethanopterin reductase-like flavin-dependent oxidoreductase (luciferase family)